jgi:hypothetical protein
LFFKGRQLACELSRYGVSLVLWDIDEEENKKTYEALRALGHRRIYLHKVDLTNENEVREVAKLCKDKHGHISMIFQCASTNLDLKSIFDQNKSLELIKAFRLLYESNTWLYQEMLPKMIEKNCGHLILFTNGATILNQSFSVDSLSTIHNSQIKLVECVNAELNESNKNNKICYSIVYLRHRILKDTDVKKIVKLILKNRNYIYIPFYLNYVNMLKSILPTECFGLLFSSSSSSSSTLRRIEDNKKNN